MTDSATASPQRRSPLGQLVISRLREFYREPEAIFWVYAFPIIMIVGLGLAFPAKRIDSVSVDVQAGPLAEDVSKKLAGSSKEGELVFTVEVKDEQECWQRLRTGKTDLVVIATETTSGREYQYQLDKSREKSSLARAVVHNALQEASGRKDVVPTSKDKEMTEPGSRYIDFLVPGLLGMGLMGGGLWGVGFVLVDMRIRKLLKRFLATPMKRSDFLLSVLISRLVFIIPEVLVIFVCARLFFGVESEGSLLSVAVLIVLGAYTFAGIGLLIASRAKTIEAVSGLMNAVMLPMWLASGIFFSTERFPEFLQPFVRALPLTPLIRALRAVMLEGAPLTKLWDDMAILAAYGIVSFLVAVKIFRWN